MNKGKILLLILVVSMGLESCIILEPRRPHGGYRHGYGYGWGYRHHHYHRHPGRFHKP